MKLNHRELQTILSALRRYRQRTSIASRCLDFALDLKSATHSPLEEHEFLTLEGKYTHLLQARRAPAVSESFVGGSHVPPPKDAGCELQKQEFDLGGEG